MTVTCHGHIKTLLDFTACPFDVLNLISFSLQLFMTTKRSYHFLKEFVQLRFFYKIFSIIIISLEQSIALDWSLLRKRFGLLYQTCQTDWYSSFFRVSFSLQCCGPAPFAPFNNCLPHWSTYAGETPRWSDKLVFDLWRYFK